VNNQVNPALFSPAAVNLAKKLPTTTDPCGETKYAASTNSDEWQLLGRSDYQMSPTNTLFGRYMATSYVAPAPYATTQNVLATATPGLDNLAQSAVVGNTKIFGTNTVNSLRFAYNRTSVHRGNPPFFDPHAIGSNVYSYNPGEMVLTVTGGFNISAGTGDWRHLQDGCVADQRRPDRRARQPSVRRRRRPGVLEDGLPDACPLGRQLDVQRAAARPGPGGLLMGRVGRLEHGGPGALPMNQYHPRALRAGHLADDRTA
jgi:hypothetical protein